MYLCTVLDLYSRRVVGWTLSGSLDTELVVASVAMAMIRRRPPRGLMFHFDRGVQYTSGQFKAIVKGYGFIQSMSRRSNCWDNAWAKTFFKNLRAELIRARSTEARREQGRYLHAPPKSSHRCNSGCQQNRGNSKKSVIRVTERFHGALGPRAASFPHDGGES
jgi:transposase InsO family protein